MGFDGGEGDGEARGYLAVGVVQAHQCGHFSLTRRELLPAAKFSFRCSSLDESKCQQICRHNFFGAILLFSQVLQFIERKSVEVNNLEA